MLSVNLNELVAQTEPAENQLVKWSARTWRNRSVQNNLGWDTVLDELEKLSSPTNGALVMMPRSAVRMIAQRCPGEFSPIDLLVACCVWGFGQSRDGIRTKGMVETPDASRILTEIIEVSRTDGVAGFGSLFEDWRGRINGLGVSFGTKLVHFAATSTSPSPLPLIYDRYVAIGLRDVVDRDFPYANGRVRSADYGRYLYVSHQAAVETGRPPEDVEFALFRHGKGLV